jgi:putative oxidoreductase
MKLNTDLGLLLLRLAVGGTIWAHGAQKLLGWFGGPGWRGTLGFMGAMHIPPIAAWLSILAEFFGGIALVTGVGARIAALAIAIDMLVALLVVHLKNGFFLGEKPGIEYVFVLGTAALSLAIMGPGRFGFVARSRKGA